MPGLIEEGRRPPGPPVANFVSSSADASTVTVPTRSRAVTVPPVLVPTRGMLISLIPGWSELRQRNVEPSVSDSAAPCGTRISLGRMTSNRAFG